jgi:hypothetical protein
MVFKNEVDFNSVYTLYYYLCLIDSHLFQFIYIIVSVVVLNGIGLEYQGNCMNQDLKHTDVHV